MPSVAIAIDILERQKGNSAAFLPSAKTLSWDVWYSLAIAETILAGFATICGQELSDPWKIGADRCHSFQP